MDSAPINGKPLSLNPYIPPIQSISSIPFSPPKPKRSIGQNQKGKQQALDDGTYPGEITFRNILGNGNGGSSNPLRVIAHIDIDAAYAAMEMARLKLDPNVPVAVQQWQGLIAVNYPAREFGISRHESPREALIKCPQLVMVHCATYKNGDEVPSYDNPNPLPETHKISLDYYRRESLKIIKVFGQHCSVVEKASIDESYLDLTLPVRALLVERYPFLATLPEGATLDTILPSPLEMGVRIDWPNVGNVIPLSGVELKVEPVEVDTKDGEGIEEVEEVPVPSTSQLPVASQDQQLEELVQLEHDMANDRLTWSDVCLAIGAEIVNTCRNSVQTELGYTCSAGIAPNKMLSKLCSAWKKPNAQTILRFAAVGNFLRPMKFQKIRNLGGKLGAAIKASYEVETVGDLLGVSLSDMQEKMGGDTGMWCWEIIRGIDHSEVESKTNVKSMLSSKNFRPSIDRYSEILHWLGILSTELHLRLGEARENSPGLWPKTITFTHRSPQYVIRSHQIAFPFTSRLSINYINNLALKLLKVAIGDNNSSIPLKDNSKIGPYSNIQLSFSGLEKLEEGQKGIEKFFGVGPVASTSGGVKREVEDDSNSTSNKKLKFDEGDVVTTKEEEGEKVEEEEEEEEEIILPDLPTFTCSRCSKTLSIPISSIKDIDTSNIEGLENLLEKEKAEHLDYHFARDMFEVEREVEREVIRGPNNSFKSSNGTKKGKNVERVVGVERDKGKGKEIEEGQQSLKGFFTKKKSK